MSLSNIKGTFQISEETEKDDTNIFHKNKNKNKIKIRKLKNKNRKLCDKNESYKTKIKLLKYEREILLSEIYELNETVSMYRNDLNNIVFENFIKQQKMNNEIKREK